MEVKAVSQSYESSENDRNAEEKVLHRRISLRNTTKFQKCNFMLSKERIIGNQSYFISFAPT